MPEQVKVMRAEEAKVVEQPEVVITEESDQSPEPHQVGLPLMPVTLLLEPPGEVGNLP